VPFNVSMAIPCGDIYELYDLTKWVW
jgi:hypothetical protein